MTQLANHSPNPNARIFDPDAIATYCLWSNTYVIGDAFHSSLVGKCHSGLPVFAFAATNAPPSSAKNTNPPAVDSVPPHDSAVPVSGSSQTTDPVFRSNARRIFCGLSSGAVRDEPPM